MDLSSWQSFCSIDAASSDANNLMSNHILEIDNVVKRFGGVAATDDVTLHIVEREIHGLIGPNGAGKTTLIAQLSGEQRQNSGSIRFAGEEISTYRSLSAFIEAWHDRFADH